MDKNRCKIFHEKGMRVCNKEVKEKIVVVGEFKKITF